MDCETKVFRGTWISPIVWTLLILFIFSSPVGFLLGWLSSFVFPGNDEVNTLVGLSGIVLMLVFCWMYHRTLRVELSPQKIVKSSFFGRKEVPLDEKTVFKYKATTVSIQGVDFEVQGRPEVNTNFHIQIINGKQKIYVGSAIKNVSELYEDFISFELGVIVPAYREKLRAGELIQLIPFEFSRSDMLYRSARYSLPLEEAVCFDSGKLVVPMGRKRIKIKMHKIANPYAVTALMSGEKS